MKNESEKDGYDLSQTEETIFRNERGLWILPESRSADQNSPIVRVNSRISGRGGKRVAEKHYENKNLHF